MKNDGTVVTDSETSEVIQVVSSPIAPLNVEPDPMSDLCTELLYGEHIEVLSLEDNWILARSDKDGSVGYVSSQLIHPLRYEPTHVVTAVRAPIRLAPFARSRAVSYLSMNSRVNVRQVEGDFCHVDDLGWIPSSMIAPLGTYDFDFVETALKFLNVPLVWGGRSCDGLDCSGFLQVCLERAGIIAPRSANDQASVLGVPLSDPLGEPKKRGDLLFFDRHVGIFLNNSLVVHEGGEFRRVVVQPFEEVLHFTTEVLKRQFTCIRRLPYVMAEEDPKLPSFKF